MWYLILLSFLVRCANRYSEEFFLQGMAGGSGDKFMEPTGRWPGKDLGTTELY
jgi:hypothetical protein